MKPYKGKESKKVQVQSMFDRIAPTYDRLNHLLSFEFDRLWRRRVVRMVARQSPREILDVATGTADLAIALAREIPEAHVTGVDLSEQMVVLGQEKVRRAALSQRVRLETGDAERMTSPDGCFDAVTVAFGVRNFQDLPQGLAEMYRVLREGGSCYVLEFSRPTHPLFAPLYRFYFHRVLPVVGGIVSRDRAAYDYLPHSVDEFPARRRFEELMRDAGFTDVRSVSLMGGIAYIYSGCRA